MLWKRTKQFNFIKFQKALKKKRELFSDDASTGLHIKFQNSDKFSHTACDFLVSAAVFFAQERLVLTMKGKKLTNIYKKIKGVKSVDSMQHCSFWSLEVTRSF